MYCEFWLSNFWSIYFHCPEIWGSKKNICSPWSAPWQGPWNRPIVSPVRWRRKRIPKEQIPKNCKCLRYQNVCNDPFKVQTYLDLREYDIWKRKKHTISSKTKHFLWELIDISKEIWWHTNHQPRHSKFHYADFNPVTVWQYSMMSLTEISTLTILESDATKQLQNANFFKTLDEKSETIQGRNREVLSSFLPYI